MKDIDKVLAELEELYRNCSNSIERYNLFHEVEKKMKELREEHKSNW